jgi:oxalate decarboxylase/phosphoglucose isomerase-like protein (cupin superfamily)
VTNRVISRRTRSRTARNSRRPRRLAAALVVVKPGSMRELHWHPNADDWQYGVQYGSARQHHRLPVGDVGLVRRNCGHYVENTGDDDLVFIETFYEEVSLANWLSYLPPKLVSAHPKIPRRPSPSSRAGAENRAAAIVAWAGADTGCHSGHVGCPDGAPLAERDPQP